MLRLNLSIFTLMLIIHSMNLSANETVITPYFDSNEDTYASQLLQRALLSQNKTVRQISHTQPLSGVRLEQAFDDNELQIIWAPMESVKDSPHHVIEIPIFRGLLSYYQIVQLSDRSSLPLRPQDIERMELGIFRDDAQLHFLEGAGFQVVAVKHIQNLKDMLDGARFDAILAPAGRLYNHSGNEHVSQNFLLSINSPWVYVVHKSRPDLARNLRSGLNAMLADGSLDNLLTETPWMAALQTQLENNAVQVVTLADNSWSQDLALEFLLYAEQTPLLTATF